MQKNRNKHTTKRFTGEYGTLSKVLLFWPKEARGETPTFNRKKS